MGNVAQNPSLSGQWSAQDDPLESILMRAAGGDERALEQLYDATSHRVYGLALRILRQKETAEEATLEVYTQVWRRGAQYDPERGSVLSYLLTLARTRSLDLLRSGARRAEVEQPFDDPADQLEAIDSFGAHPKDVYAVQRMQLALAALPKEQRIAIEAAYFGGLSHSEVATALNQPLGTVKTRIRDGLMTLRRVMAVREEGHA